ncbi:TPA: hypothetical protein N0F65_000149 [Lagenidium giganteum]|uniref:Uncharacterized protein n=1 Tax=Lagenidium giganteum TaxID=4803 RepID=A0AAV2YJR2_9STRA|nr:TPA: hypothetical protein N0F65_000149 [Lagenidium giganteum]
MRKTPNPFMTTSSGIIGINLNEPVVFEAPKVQPENNQLSAGAVSANSLKDFMYQTTSKALGDGVPVRERSQLSKRMDKSTLQKGLRLPHEVDEKGLVRIKSVDVVSPSECMLNPEEIIAPNLDTRSISDARTEHPMYATSNRDIGAEKAQLKVEIERRGRPNTFTTTFNGFRYRDYGLNTAVTKSRICDQLDYS